MTDANDDAGRKCVNGIHGAHGAVEFAVDFALVQNVGTRNIEDGFLRACTFRPEKGDCEREKDVELDPLACDQNV